MGRNNHKPHYDKPWLSLDEQISRVEERGMTDAHEYAMEFARIGYYRLSGYWYPLRRIDQATGKRLDEFVEGARFEHVMRLYRYDEQLRAALYSALSKIEVALRVKTGYVLGRRDAFAYLKPAMLKDDLDVVDYANFVSSFTREAKRNNEDYAEHFRNDYDGQMPLWAATEAMTLSNLISLLLCMKPEDRDEIAADFGVSRGALRSWFPTLIELRNSVAHQERLFDREFDNIPNWEQRPELAHAKQANEAYLQRLENLARMSYETYREFQQSRRRTRIYGQIAVIAYMLRNLGDDDEALNLKRCLEAFPTDVPGMSPNKTMGIPDHWKNQILWNFDLPTIEESK
ncbi:Abi family protein [Bifidobacterium miconisargentati]|uniref:Abi family protein n=1 Tax=Bifidobacterium miconisargentati TaxID=2834437 RepID=UPI001BDDADC0|nr:Abi family protein [Bifidobacterium miconisargentati]MBW3090064.1 Abi family protein [Bifidobacterium miconisargentati]